jgi:hypothetical protein
VRLVRPQMYASGVISRFHIRPRIVDDGEIIYREKRAAMIVQCRVTSAVWYSTTLRS